MKRLKLVAYWSTFAVTAFACSGKGDTEPPSISDGGSMSSDGGTGGTTSSDGGTRSGGGTSSGGEAGGGTASNHSTPSDEARDVEMAIVFVHSHSGTTTHSVSVAFLECTIEPVAGCEIETCLILGETGSHFGTLRVAAGATEYEIVPNARGEYPHQQGTGSLWELGDPIRVSAEGSEWPAFDEILAGPGPILPNEPGPPTFSRNAPATLSWVSGGSAQALIHLGFETTDENLNALRCVTDASAGEITVPAAALARIPERVSSLSVVLVAEDRRVLPVELNREMRIVARSSMHTFPATLE